MMTVALADYEKSSIASQIATNVKSHIAFYAAIKKFPSPLPHDLISLRLSF
jgi:hypothetical protein